MIVLSMQIETCSSPIIHLDVVEKVTPKIIDPETSDDLANLFKVFADPTRLKIISALFVSEMCVCDLAYALNMTQSSISHQLKTFKDAKLVKFRREGKVIYYSLADSHIKDIFFKGLEHVHE